ncbi:Arb2 domain-containing protein [Drechmeria coniospora]|uniref:Arb2 domain-containing protein n=1 Tax=Drechmeria coniospora TaxID=98403 RepID=A0A151GPC7_DRECN|nr:Arb2 domain-containing protein [Drechmeria coniospora]KYK58946.1 Arb2 domain-containing protein [Drechmeria coniospora]
MFRRQWSSLPKEPSFQPNFQSLGYFINDQDEIRSIEAPDCYFKFFLNRNPRINELQRFAFNQALEDEVHARLEMEGLRKVTLPMGSTPDHRHLPIFVSHDLGLRSRVVVIFGESTQDLGILASRVANGVGGIDEGSMVSVVRALQHHVSSDADLDPPGIVLANTGQLYWWPEGKRALTTTASMAVPLPSLVHRGRRHVPALNSIPGNEVARRHVGYMFDTVLRQLTGADAKFSVVAVGDSCELVTRFLDEDVKWEAHGRRLSSMLLLGHVYPDDDLTNDDLKNFLAKASRAYLTSSHPLDTPLAPPAGNAKELIPNLGCPCFSSSEPCHTELILVRALGPALKYLEQAATTPGFENPPIVVVDVEEDEPEACLWDREPEGDKPLLWYPVGSGHGEERAKLEAEMRHTPEAGISSAQTSAELN